MHKVIDSSKLAKQVSEKLNLSQADSMELYKELSQIQNGFVKDALNALLDKLNALTEQKSELNTYAACIKGSSVRDAQYEKISDSEYLDDEAWIDANDMPLFLEIVEAGTPTRAIQIAAAHAGVEENVITLFPMS